jgi:hypothetical protein
VAKIDSSINGMAHVLSDMSDNMDVLMLSDPSMNVQVYVVDTSIHHWRATDGQSL